MSDTAGSMGDTAGAGATGTVDRLLLEAGLDDDGGLRPVLHELRALAAGRPVPSAAVAALMNPASDHPAATRHLAAVPEAVADPRTAAAPQSEPDPEIGAAAATDELAARRRSKRRLTLTTLSLAVSLAAGGAAAVASNEGLRYSFGDFSHAVTSFVATLGGSAPEPGQTPAEGPAGPAAPATVPAAPAPTHAPAVPPGSGARQDPQLTPTPLGSAGVPLPDLPVPENVVPGGQLNGESTDLPALPLPATPPVPLPSPRQ